MRLRRVPFNHRSSLAKIPPRLRQDAIEKPGTDPSFYMSLFFRPQFVPLFSDIAMHVENAGSPSCQEADVATGEPYSNNLLFVSSIEEHEPQG